MVPQTLKILTCLLFIPAAALAVDPVATHGINVDAAGNPTSTFNLAGPHVTGTLNPARLGTGTPTSSTVLTGFG